MFVEGITEILFVKKVLEQLVDLDKVYIEHRKIEGGSSVPRYVMRLSGEKKVTKEKFYILLLDCGGDKQVLSRILEEHKGLYDDGYAKIIGIRDVRPDFTYVEIPRLQAAIKLQLQKILIPVEFILSTMEIEAWFLAEHSHFERYDAALNINAINTLLGFNLLQCDVTTIANPSLELNRIYNLVGRTYDKSKENPTIKALDFSFICNGFENRVPQFHELLSSLKEFLKPIVIKKLICNSPLNFLWNILSRLRTAKH